jgi:DNA helicase-2/ATP-dependent DNA helicase PcrA
MADNEYEMIVTTLDRPVLVLAGPGAGKTFLLGDRTKRLLDAGIDKESITLLTFGKAASQNMRNKLLDPRSGFGIPYERLPHVATLHSISFEIVNRKPQIVGLQKTDLRVQSNEDVKRLLFRDAALILGLSESEAIAALRYKQDGEFEKKTNKSSYSICEKYWEIMSKCNYIDFDDQVNFACRILETETSILKEYQAKCQHLLVDEYQDINAAQFKLIQLLSEQSRKGLFAVGDDAQSIYGFRGADPTYILHFTKNYTGAATPPLAHSRRCHQRIMEDAARMLKTYYPEWIGPYDLAYHVPAGDEPYIWHVPSDKAEAEWIARIARQAVAEKKTVLVLAPKRIFFPRISMALRSYGVPHGCPVNLLPENINARFSTISDILEWLKKPEDSFLTRLAIESLMNHGQAKVPGANKSRRCSRQTIEKRIEVESEVAKLWENISKRSPLFTILRDHPKPSTELETIRETLSKLFELYGKTGRKFHGEFAKQLSLSVGSWAESQKIASDLSLIIKQLETSESTGFGSVKLMTMRNAKGLEADVVVIAGLEDDLMPNPASDIAEEARLFYVSMTRAKEKLYLLHSFKRLRSISYGYEITDKKRSRFLESVGRKSKYMRDKARTS